MSTGEFNAEGNPTMDNHPIQGRVEILLVALCYRNDGTLRPDGPLCSYAGLTYLRWWEGGGGGGGRLSKDEQDTLLTL